MAFHPQAIVRGNRVTKECPVCGEDMIKGHDGLWHCQNETCAHTEAP